ncbi:major capsid pentamer protein [Mycobacterium phage Knocker]|nr:major capsid pentamer protein [Mycobacterium phage Knocker]
MTTPVLDAVQFEAPNVTPAVPGLFAATAWQNDPDMRWLSGVVIRGANYGGDGAVGAWGQPWCSVPALFDAEADPGDPGSERKFGERPDIADRFDPVTVWAYDECDLTAPSRREVEDRARQILTLEEQPLYERAFAARLNEDAADVGIESFPTLKAAVAYLEGQIALTNTMAFLHIAADVPATEPDLFIKSGTSRVSPSGHTWVIGGGYVGADTLWPGLIVATSQPFGWRDAPTTRTAMDERHNLYAAVAERSVLVGYEAVIAAAQVIPDPAPTP